MNSKIQIYELEPKFSEHFDALESTAAVQWTEEALDQDNAGESADAEIISTFIASRLDAEILREFPRLKLIATRSTGFDHIDLDYCRKRNISVCNVPNYASDTVAEHAFALLLALTRKLEMTLYLTRHGAFTTEGLRGMGLYGKTIGIIGTGHIGSSMVRIADGFGMQILAYDLVETPELFWNHGVSYMEFDQVLEQSDIISIHIPGGDETRNMFDDAQFDRMKESAILINTARGDIINTDSLIRALSDGRLAAAGLDVLPAEAELRSTVNGGATEKIWHANHALMNMHNVIVSPHNAFNTHGSVTRIIELTIANIKAYMANEPINIVT